MKRTPRWVQMKSHTLFQGPMKPMHAAERAQTRKEDAEGGWRWVDATSLSP